MGEKPRVTTVVLSSLALFALGLVTLSPPASAQSSRDAPETRATDFHGAPGNTPGFGGSSANPQGEGVNGGNGIHGIANNPGQSGNQPSSDDPGGPAQDMHGGLDVGVHGEQ